MDTSPKKNQDQLTEEEKKRLFKQGSSTISRAFVKHFSTAKDVQQPPEEKKYSSTQVVPKSVGFENAPGKINLPPLVVETKNHSDQQPQQEILKKEPQSSPEISPEPTSFTIPLTKTDPLFTIEEKVDQPRQSLSQAGAENKNTPTEFKPWTFRSLFQYRPAVAVFLGIAGIILLSFAVVFSNFAPKGIVRIKFKDELNASMIEQFHAELMNRAVISEIIQAVEVLPKNSMEQQNWMEHFWAEYQEHIQFIAKAGKKEIVLVIDFPEATKTQSIRVQLEEHYKFLYDLHERSRLIEKKFTEANLKEAELKKEIDELAAGLSALEYFGLWRQTPDDLKQKIKPMISLILRSFGAELKSMEEQIKKIETALTVAPTDLGDFISQGNLLQDSRFIEHEKEMIRLGIQQALLVYAGEKGKEYLKMNLQATKALEMKTSVLVYEIYNSMLTPQEQSQFGLFVEKISLESRKKIFLVLIQQLNLNPEKLGDSVEDFQEDQSRLAGLNKQYEVLLAEHSEYRRQLKAPMPEISRAITSIKSSPSKWSSLSLLSFAAAILIFYAMTRVCLTK
jgi:hypothetical protein